MFTPAVVILGAGQSSRMGRAKLLLPWGRTSIAGHLVEVWRRAGAKQIGLVCADLLPVLQEELARAGLDSTDCILNPNPALGMFESIRCAARWPHWSSTLTHWALVLGDQPHLQPATIDNLLSFARAHPESVCQPARHGRPRHPVILPRPIFARLEHSKAAHLKAFLAEHPVELCELADPGLDLDIDTPEDYHAAQMLCFKEILWNLSELKRSKLQRAGVSPGPYPTP